MRKCHLYTLVYIMSQCTGNSRLCSITWQTAVQGISVADITSLMRLYSSHRECLIYRFIRHILNEKYFAFCFSLTIFCGSPALLVNIRVLWNSLGWVGDFLHGVDMVDGVYLMRYTLCHGLQRHVHKSLGLVIYIIEGSTMKYGILHSTTPINSPLKCCILIGREELKIRLFSPLPAIIFTWSKSRNLSSPIGRNKYNIVPI